jgi:hypothetical protein
MYGGSCRLTEAHGRSASCPFRIVYIQHQEITGTLKRNHAKEAMQLESCKNPLLESCCRKALQKSVAEKRCRRALQKSIADTALVAQDAG